MNETILVWLESAGAEILVSLFVSSTVLLVMAFFACWYLRKGSAANRFSVWQAAFVGLLILPVGSLVLPQVHLGRFSDSRDSVVSHESFDANEVGMPRELIAEHELFSQPAESEDSAADQVTGLAHRVNDATQPSNRVLDELGVPLTANTNENPIAIRSAASEQPTFVGVAWNRITAIRWVAVLSALWLLIVMYGLARIVRSSYLVFGIRKRAFPLDRSEQTEDFHQLDQILEESGVPVLVSSDVSIPVTMGILNPCIVIPSDAVNWPLARLRMVLKHELSHVQRRDVTWQLIAAIAKCVFWFQPLAWIAERKMQLERERACDDLVIGLDEVPNDYAMVLLQFAAEYSGRKFDLTGALSMAQKPIESRLITILEPLTRRGSSSVWFRVVIGCLFCAIVLLASICRPFGAPSVFAAPRVAGEVSGQDKNEISNSPAETSKTFQSSEAADGMIRLPNHITGRVVDQKGNPIKGATAVVRLLPYSQWNQPGEDKKYELKPPVTDEHGLFTLETRGIDVPKEGFKISGEFYSPAHPKRSLGVSVKKVGDTIVKGDPVNVGDFDLFEGRKVTGRVVAPEDNGMRLAAPDRAFVRAARGMPGFWWSSRVECDPEGNFVILIPKAGVVELIASAQNYTGTRVNVPVNEEYLGENALYAGTEVFGTVVDRTGNPVAGAVVKIEEISEENKTQIRAMSFEVSSGTKTNEQGQYRFPPHRGECRISIARSGRERGSDDLIKSGPTPIFESKTILLSKIEEQEVNFKAAETIFVRGTIRWPDAKPAANVETRSHGGFCTEYTDENGRYELEVLKNDVTPSISAFGARDANGQWYYAYADGAIGMQFAKLTNEGRDIEGADWVLRKDTSSENRRKRESDQALDEISVRFSRDFAAFLQAYKDDGVPIISQKMIYHDDESSNC